MELLLSIISYKNSRPEEIVTHRFGDQGGTIGRGPSNTLVLRDPEQFISRTHARIDWRRNAFVLTVLGKNPAELNGRPIHQGEDAQLSDGDELMIGDYVLETSVNAVEADTAAFATPLGSTTRVSLHGTATVSEPIRPQIEQKVAYGVSLFGGGLTEAVTHSHGNRHSGSGTVSNHLPAINEPVPPMRALRSDAQAMLEQWDPFAADEEELFVYEAPLFAATPARETAPKIEHFSHQAVNGSNVAVEETSVALKVEPLTEAQSQPTTPLEPPAKAPQTNAISHVPNRFLDSPSQFSTSASVNDAPGPILPHADALRRLLQAAGVPDVEDRALNDPDIMHGVGEVLRETIEGLHRVLRGRAVTKREMRVDQTMMEASGNNPLKFTPDAREALRYLLAPRGDIGFMPPVKAVREAFNDIQAHNLAVMAGVRAALHSVFARFDPSQIEARLKTQGFLDKVVPMNRKARMWDLMTELHAMTVREAQDDFEQLFGQTFAKAYQDEMRKFRGGAKSASTLHV